MLRALSQYTHNGTPVLYSRAGIELGFQAGSRSYWGGFMELKRIATIAVILILALPALGQDKAPQLPPAPANAPAPSLQANADPGYDAALAACKNPPRKMPPIRWPATGPGPRDYKVSEIPGVIAAGQEW